MSTGKNYNFYILAIAVLALVMTSISAAAQNNDEIKVYNPAPISQEDYVIDELIVKFKDEVKDTDIEKINSILKTSSIRKSDLGRFHRLRIPKDKTVLDMVSLYRKLPNVEYAEPNYVAHALMTPNDPYFSLQWHLYNAQYNGINVRDAWDISNGSNVIIAVLDTGVAYENYCQSTKCYYKAPDLAGTTFIQGYDFANNDNHANDDHSHGTHVAGTIAQTTNNGVGVAGVAFKAKIMPVKVLNSAGSGTYEMIANGIRFAADNGAKVISMSLGGSSPSTTLQNALAYAYNKGVVIIAAAGNDGMGGPASYPAAYDAYVIAVASTRYDEARSYFSTTGNYVDIAAPGGDVTVDQNNDGYGDGVLQQTFDPNTKKTNAFGYWFFQGTSMATPHVSGVAALLIANGVTNPADVRNAIEQTAEDKGPAGKDSEYGYGIVNALAALQYNSQPCTDLDLDTYCAETNDCNDNNATVHPGASEVFCNGVDNDCDNSTDENYVPYNCGFGPCQAQSTCSSGAESCTPLPNSQQEVCDGIDNDCNNATDDSLINPLCENQIGVCAGSTKTCGGSAGWVQCDASNYGPNYQSTETDCGDGLDNDCDGQIDEGVQTTFYQDFDVDSYGNVNVQQLTCSQPQGYVADSTDCNDNNNSIHPGALDSACDGVDNDCDLSIDEDYVATQTNCGVGACASTGQLNCVSGQLENTCTPGIPTAETCNGIDDDCDGLVDDGIVCAVQCWEGDNAYLRRQTSQYRKFCKCAQGNYGYSSVRTVSRRTVFYYTDSGNNANWATASTKDNGVNEVKCADNGWYKTNVDYYR